MSEHVLVRMYNVGFGDCFLIEFPATPPAGGEEGGEAGGERPLRILVDCGAHRAGYPREGWQPADTVATILEDIADPVSGPQIDVVIATHRHQDHVSGFGDPAWERVTVGEVWLPWTEDPKDPEATAIRNRQSRLALGLQHAFRQASFDDRRHSAAVVTSLRALAANSLTNEAAMRTLHSGFKGKPRRRFLCTTRSGRVPYRGSDELVVHILGPSRGPETIRDMDPPAGQSYLRFGGSGGGTGTRSPFSRSFTLTPEEYENDNLGGEPLDEQIKEAATAIMRDDDLAAAVSLDRAVNGTSLMLMFEFRNAFLLFSGDAQWGTWRAALADPESRDLLSRTTFYKIGHHGSYNATPVEFVRDVLPRDHKLWGAVASVHSVEQWPEIPRRELLTALRARCAHVVRSDRPGQGGAGVVVRPDDIGVDFRVPC